MTPCSQTIAKGIALDCDKSLVAGWTGRAVYIPYSVNPTITKSGTNPRVVTAVTASSVIGVLVQNNDPFAGTNVAGSTDNGRAQFVKTFATLIPMHGADVAKDTIEPLIKNLQGGMLIIERKDKAGYGSFVVFGLYDPVIADASTYSRDESANGGAASLSFICREDYEECNFFDTDYATTKTAFDALFTAAV